MQSLVAFISILALLPSAVSSWRIEKGGTLSEKSSWQVDRRTPPNTLDPDYFHPTSSGGRPQQSGNDGMVLFVAKVHTSAPPTQFETVDVPPVELRAQYFFLKEHEYKKNAVQEYVVPGDGRRRPYEQEVRVKVWGGGGGGCDGGRGETTESVPEQEVDSDAVKFSEGCAGGYVEATFLLPVGDVLQVVVGGGGMSQGSLPSSLGGKGGYNGGLPGRQDLMSGGGGGGGLSSISWNGTIIAAAYGGEGGGNTTYCTAQGGVGASLRGQPKNAGGYLDLDLALPDSTPVELVCPGVPAIITLTHESAVFSWNAGPHCHERSKDLYVQKYTVYVAEGHLEEDSQQFICSSDYKLHEHIQRDIDVTKNATTSLNNLRASAAYCIRIEAFQIEGLSLGVQILPFTTKPMPVNEWLPVSIRQLEVSSSSEASEDNENSADTESMRKTSTSYCEHSSSRPTGRRGHSMTVINNQVYIFGGATLKCVCEWETVNNERVCSSQNVYSDELWHFDPITAIFTQLKGSKGDAWPRGREQHSATALPNGDIIVIGGMSSSNTDSDIITGQGSEMMLADVWRLKDPHHISSYAFSGMDMSEEALPIELVPGQVTSHEIPIFVNDSDSLGEEKMCVSDIQVRVSVLHNCLDSIDYIKLTGPGTIHATDHNAPQSRDFETKIFVSSMANREKGNAHFSQCQDSFLNLIFSDHAQESVLSHANIPTSGTFRPASSLVATFGGVPLNGSKWKLSIAVSQPMYSEAEEYHGQLTDWELMIDAKPCNILPKWEQLAMPPAIFSPRRLHTAVAVDSSIFVANGFADRKLNDLWRFDYDSYTWTELKNAAIRSSWPLNGQISFLCNCGLLAYGGIGQDGPRQRGHDLWLLDLLEGDWVPVPIAQSLSEEDNEHFNNGMPYERYLSSIGILDNVDSIYKSYSIEGNGSPIAISFGGDGGLLHNSQVNSYGFMPNTFFDDVWFLSPGGIHVSSTMNKRDRDDYCNWGWAPGSMSSSIWNNTCGWSPSNDVPSGKCQLESIFLAAWCRQQYQSFYMS